MGTVLLHRSVNHRYCYEKILLDFDLSLHVGSTVWGHKLE